MTSTIRIPRGLDLPIAGSPKQTIEDGPKTGSVAVIGLDYLGLKPKMAIAEGDRVSIGQTLFHHKRDPAVQFTAPGSGTISAINRGARRVLQSVVIELDDDESPPEIVSPRSADDIGAVTADELREALCSSGLWTAFRSRPYSQIPKSDSTPEAIFVTAMDSNPLAADAAVIIAEQPEAFAAGVRLLTRLTAGTVHVCHAHGDSVSGQLENELQDITLRNNGNGLVKYARGSDGANGNSDGQVSFTGFDGPHPAGLAGTHIHFLDPVSAERTVWSIGYQDVIAIGKLFLTGTLWLERVVALGGPVVNQPRLLRTRLGACIDDLVAGEYQDDVEVRIISGSVLSGRRANNWANYLGRFHTQVSIIAEGRSRQPFGWVDPRGRKFSLLNVFLSSFRRKEAEYDFHTSTHGSPRAMVPIGSYERVMPLDMLATQLLRSLLVRDTDNAQKLGCLELDEEDLALCSFVCHGKYDFGPALRANLEQIEKEG
ncbi:MAG: NADH:ubiquinone reductase (Na(+)-transporting) subunit A [Gammaproteobacteria bacterium]|nr:MAG: NADH:ubiquinone reductase (Na(+)-transporting) subunit A [Gammaproteobacteria bacterium]